MTENSEEKKTPGQIVKDSMAELQQTAVAFVKAPKALWGVNIPYVIEGLIYFGILTILGKFCSENIQLTDLQAGWVYSLVTAGITLAMLFLGGVSDKIGVRKALILAFVLFFVGRGIIALSGTLSLGHGLFSPMFFMLITGLFIMVVAYGLYQPAAYAGVKRYTNPQTAAMGYAVVYGLMNLGAFFSGFISPFVRHRFETVFPPNGLTAVFWVYTALVMVALLVTVFILTPKTDSDAVERMARETEKMEAEGKTQEEITENVEKKKRAEDAAEKHRTDMAAISNLMLYLYGIITVAALVVLGLVHTGKIPTATASVHFGMKPIEWTLSIGVLLFIGFATWEFLRKRPTHPFRDKRFTFFIFILIPVQTLFAHNWLTLPYYLDRAFRGGMVSQYFEFFSNLNPILIFFLAPIVAGLTARANVYRMMVIGTLVMAAPTFLLAFGPNVYLFLTYVLLMSVGEAMWQPRFLQWIAEIAPEGQTGLYMGIGQFPWFLTKMVTGFYSGYFVAKYLPRPESGLPTHSGQMWLIYAFIAMISPIALILASGWMKKGMHGKA